MPAGVQSTSNTKFFNFNHEQFGKSFPHHPFGVKHELSSRREFQLPQLVQLASRLPANNVEYYVGDVPVNQDRKPYPTTGLSAVETIRQIEECGSWMVMKHVETDPEYAHLMKTLLAEVRDELAYSGTEKKLEDMHRESAFIFISSPNSTTPYHLDDEHNFLLQIRGTKQVTIWDPNDRAVMPEPQAEDMLQCWHASDYQRYMPYKDEFEKTGERFCLSPGDGLHFPFGAPHWVKNGPAVSISFSVTFHSLISEKNGAIYYINKRLRKFGMEPTPPGKSVWRDSIKYNTFLTAHRTAGMLRGSFGPRKLNNMTYST